MQALSEKLMSHEEAINATDNIDMNAPVSLDLSSQIKIVSLFLIAVFQLLC